MTNKIKLVAADIDGTLLLNWDPRGIDPQVFECIEALDARGVRFMAASGRQYTNLRRLFSPVADHVSYLCENGALMIDRGEVLFKRTMDPALATDIFHAVTETPGCAAMASGVVCGYALASEPAFIDHLRRVVGNDITPVDAPEDIPEPVVKLCFHAEPERMAQVVPLFEERFHGRCTVVTSGATWMDFMPAGVDKGTALDELGALWDIDSSEMLAIGDEMNDVQMLRYVGRPYLMESGNDEVARLIPEVGRCKCVADVLRDLLEARA